MAITALQIDFRFAFGDIWNLFAVDISARYLSPYLRSYYYFRFQKTNCRVILILFPVSISWFWFCIGDFQSVRNHLNTANHVCHSHRIETQPKLHYLLASMLVHFDNQVDTRRLNLKHAACKSGNEQDLRSYIFKDLLLSLTLQNAKVFNGRQNINQII